MFLRELRAVVAFLAMSIKDRKERLVGVAREDWLHVVRILVRLVGSCRRVDAKQHFVSNCLVFHRVPNAQNRMHTYRLGSIRAG